MSVSTAVFYLIALITVGSAAMVAFSRNIIYSAFSLLGTFMGVAGIYIFLGADFVAAVQVLIYVGGILVLILFAVMLTHRITDVEVTNRAAGRIPALIIIGVLVYLLIETVKVTPWVKAKEVVYTATTATMISRRRWPSISSRRTSIRRRCRRPLPITAPRRSRP